MSTPNFTVICPAYNARLTIQATLRSVQAQTFEDFEMVVVDDGSSDDTPELVEGFAAGDPRFRLVRQENAGTAGARNRGIAEARGALISIIDNDDMWLPDYLESVQEALVSAPGIGLCFCDIWAMSDRTRRVHRQTLDRLAASPEARVIPARELELALLEDNFVPASATTLTRKALDAAGNFDTSQEMKGSDDWDLWLRIANAGFGAIRLPGAHAIWRDREDSESKDRLMMYTSAHAAATGALERNAGDPEIAAAARSVLEETEREIAVRTDAPLTRKAQAGARRWLSSTKRMAIRNRDWREPPKELADFLDRVDPRD